MNTLNKNLNLESPNKHLLASLTLLSKDLINSNPIISGISFPMYIEFSEFYDLLYRDPNFRSKLNIFSVSKTRIIYVVENYSKDLLKDQFVKLYDGSINIVNDDFTSPVIIEVKEITYNDLINNKQIIELLNLESSTEFNKTLFFFEERTWSKIKEMLSNKNISLTVGSNTRRQFLSPIEYKFSLFLMCIGFSLEKISRTFLRYEQYDKYQQRLAIKKQKIAKFLKLQVQKRKSPKRFNKFNKNNKFNSKNKTLKTNKTIKTNKINTKQLKKNNNTLLNNSTKIKSNLKKNSPFNNWKPGSSRKFSTSVSYRKNLNNNNLTDSVIKGERKREINLDLRLNTNKLSRTANLSPQGQVPNKNNKNEISFNDSLILTFLENLENLGNLNNLDNNETKLIQQQRTIENDWVLNVRTKMNDPKYLNHNVNKTIKKAFESLQIFSSNKKQLSKLFGSNAEELVKMEYVIVAFSTILTSILNLKNRVHYTNLAGKLGLSILLHLFWTKINRKASIYDNFNEFLVVEQLDNKKQVLLGDIFLERFIDIGMLKRIIEKETKTVLITISTDYISKLAESAIIYPPSLPMICKPLIWDENKFGGYLRNGKEQRDLITGSTFKHGHKIENRNKLFQAINYFNSIKFRVNNELLTFLETNGKFLIEYLINKEFESITAPSDHLNINSKKIQEQKINLVKLNIDITLRIAKLYKDIPFYLPTNADWRGRIYTSSFFLSYQGSDFSNSLIQFWDGESLTKDGLNNLFVYGANSYNENGINKLSLETRIQWVHDNYNRILAMDQDFILKAESPLVFTAFCLTLIKWEKNPQTKIYTPIFLDATCSGIQHFAGLLKDYDLGSKVNLIAQNSNDVVGDIYSYILDPVNKEINKFGKENPEFTHFSNLALKRKDIKQPTMTKLYNVTIYGMKEQLKSNFDSIKLQVDNETDTTENKTLPDFEVASGLVSSFDKVFYKAPGINESVLLSSKDLYQIAKIINDTIFILFPSLKLVYDYLIGISDLLTKAKLPVTWSAPSGLQITQNYLKTEVHKASIKSGNVAKTIVMRQSKKEQLDNRKQKQAIIPNVIHSLDASHLINLVTTANSINLKPIITIHDCFGTHPNKMDLVNNLVLKEFIELYTKGDFLSNFHKQILKSLVDNNYEIFTTTERIIQLDNGNETLKTRTVKYIIINDEKLFIPTLPIKGSLDIDSIINSKYFIT